MPKMPPVNAKILIKFLETKGYCKSRQRGSHIILVKDNVPDPLPVPNTDIFEVSVPKHKEMAIGTLLDILKQANITRQELLDYLQNRKNR